MQEMVLTPSLPHSARLLTQPARRMTTAMHAHSPWGSVCTASVGLGAADQQQALLKTQTTSTRSLSCPSRPSRSRRHSKVTGFDTVLFACHRRYRGEFEEA